MSRRSMWSIAILVVVIAAVVVVAILVPNKTKSGTNGNTNSLTATKKASDTKAIKANVVTFFSATTTNQQRENLLQNGSQFAQPMQAEFAELDNEKPSVLVNGVSFTNPTTAKVNYTVDLDGQPVLKDQTGEALLINNTWKVSDSTLCQLFALGGTEPSACKS